MKIMLGWMVIAVLLLSGTNAFSGDLKCYGETSTTSHFVCGTHGNCTWWAAYMRPDIAVMISGSGWNGGQWYDNLVDKGFDVGSESKIGSIVDFSDPGHVAYVKGLGENGSFSVSEMNWFDSPNDGFTDGVNYATYYQGSSNTYHRNIDFGSDKQGDWTLNGFIYRKSSGTNSYCADINSRWGICWKPSNTDVSCQGGKSWRIYNFEDGSVTIISTNKYCPEAGGTGGGTFSGGPIANPPDSEDSNSNPSEITGDYGKVEMSSPDKSKSKPELYVKELKFKDEKTKYYDDEKITVYGYVKNVGADVSKKITKIAFRLFRFRGEKENGDVKEVGDENIKGENLKSGKTKEEKFEFGAPDDENVYQFFAIVDAKDVVDESNDKNNRLGNIRCRIHKRPDIKVKELLLDGGKTQFIQGIVFEARKTSKNDGGESFEDIPVEWYLNGVLYAEDNMRHWNIEHGEEKHESINVDTSFLAVGMHTLKVCADCDADKDKGNNCREVTFEVIPTEEEISSEAVLSDDSVSESSPETGTEEVLENSEVLENAEEVSENSEILKSDGEQNSSEESENSDSDETPKADDSKSIKDKKVSKPAPASASDDESGCFVGTIF